MKKSLVSAAKIDWTTSPEGRAKWREARTKAQAAANADGIDRGIERVDYNRSFSVFVLPRRENRCGHELRCEVVSPEVSDRTQGGHGH